MSDHVCNELHWSELVVQSLWKIHFIATPRNVKVLSHCYAGCPERREIEEAKC